MIPDQVFFVGGPVKQKEAKRVPYGYEVIEPEKGAERVPYGYEVIGTLRTANATVRKRLQKKVPGADTHNLHIPQRWQVIDPQTTGSAVP